MRALCGAIITAAALVGLGLTAQGIGTRYTGQPPYYSELHEKLPPKDESKQEDKKQTSFRPSRVKFMDMDRPLIFILVFLTTMSVVGLGMAFLGIIYHHMRRDREFLWEKERFGAQSQPQQRTTV